jgi:hypothetical protein
MWTIEHTRTTSASPARLFEILRDTASWPSWNHNVEWVELDGPFAAGTTGRMKNAGQDEALAFRIAWVGPDTGFEDETPIPEAGIVVRVRHAIEGLGHGQSLVRYVLSIDGPAADEIGPQIGPDISADFPEVIEGLVAMAEGRDPVDVP